ncbi:MAG: hypothetical protein KAU20_01915 [Nanoarchaeota archaeon]|nr:hypothetical protein [Nanoarchaeota archaeon]
MNKTIFSVLIAILVLGLAQVASAAIADGFDIDIDVDDDQVKPGESFEVKVDVTNNVSFDLEDIEVEVVVKDIDDEGDDDLDDEDDLKDLDSDDDDDVTFEFETPYAVKEGDYIIIVTVTGENASGDKYEVTKNATVEVEKKKHELIITKTLLDSETLKCSRVTSLAVTVWNIGNKDEDDIELSVYNTALGINQKEIFDLEEGDDEGDIKATKRLTLDLSDVEAGTYTFYVKALYDDGDKSETESFTLTVQDCPTTTPAVVVEEDEEEVIVTPAATTTAPTIITPAVTAVVEEESFFDKYGILMLIGFAYIAVIVAGIVLVVKVIRK